ncbi:PQQ-like beta-propeller repeat protein [bacterium]|nr:PQQ-like beta-propeller repeat protein [bacterium]
MMLRLQFGLFLLWFVFGTVLMAASSADDWRQWRGPNRDGISNETDLLSSWPKEGPPEVWRIPVGEGYSGVSIADGRMFTMFNDDDGEFVGCFDADTGRELWRLRTDRRYTDTWGNGPRVTPTIQGDRLYTVGARGKVFAMDTKSGRTVWTVDLAADFNCSIPNLGYSNSPLVEDDLIIVCGGGLRENAVLALDRRNGRLIWKAHSEQQSYSSPIAITAQDVRQIVVFTGGSVVSLSPKTGQIYWKHPWPNSYTENVATPIFIAPDRLFFSAKHSVGNGAGVLKIQSSNDGQLAPEVLWENNVMQAHFSSGVLDDNHIYGTHLSILKCIDVRTGEEKWAARGFGEGSVVLVDGRLIVLGTRGVLALVQATPKGYVEISKKQILHGRCFTSPSLANGKLYLRSMSEIVCLNLTRSGT